MLPSESSKPFSKFCKGVSELVQGNHNEGNPFFFVQTINNVDKYMLKQHHGRERSVYMVFIPIKYKEKRTIHKKKSAKGIFLIQLRNYIPHTENVPSYATSQESSPFVQ